MKRADNLYTLVTLFCLLITHLAMGENPATSSEFIENIMTPYGNVVHQTEESPVGPVDVYLIDAQNRFDKFEDAANYLRTELGERVPVPASLSEIYFLPKYKNNVLLLALEFGGAIAFAVPIARNFGNALNNPNGFDFMFVGGLLFAGYFGSRVGAIVGARDSRIFRRTLEVDLADLVNDLSSLSMATRDKIDWRPRALEEVTLKDINRVIKNLTRLVEEDQFSPDRKEIDALIRLIDRLRNVETSIHAWKKSTGLMFNPKRSIKQLANISRQCRESLERLSGL